MRCANINTYFYCATTNKLFVCVCDLSAKVRTRLEIADRCVRKSTHAFSRYSRSVRATPNNIFQSFFVLPPTGENFKRTKLARSLIASSQSVLTAHRHYSIISIFKNGQNEWHHRHHHLQTASHLPYINKSVEHFQLSLQEIPPNRAH